MLSNESKRVADKARALYEDKFRDALEKTDHGAFVRIERESETYFLGDTLDDAVNQAIDAYPDCLTHTLRVGHTAALHLGVITE